jgi:outer membrane protein assembly factor BamE (lipoprotein component of BamABCDE complex)
LNRDQIVGERDVSRGSSHRRAERRTGRALPRLVVAFFGAVALAACSPTVTKHGHHFQDNDVAQIQNGMSQDQVRGVLGTPTNTATIGSGSAFYYISSTQSQNAFFAPVETDRKVLAVYFNQFGAVERSTQYGLKDGKVIAYSGETTKHHARDESILRALFRNLGTKQLGLE